MLNFPKSGHFQSISGQNLFPQWCPLIRDYTVFVDKYLVISVSRVYMSESESEALQHIYKIS